MHKAVIRWLVALFFGIFALGSLISGDVLAALIIVLGRALITPQAGQLVGRKIGFLQSGLRQVAAGFVLVVVGILVGATQVKHAARDNTLTKEKTPIRGTTAKFSCERGTAANGDVVDVIGAKGHALRSAPNGDKVVNEKATRVLGSTQYQDINNSTKVQVQCVDGDWARVQITSPEWLREHKGWVERSALAQPLKPGETRQFTEADFLWDEDTAKAKAVIIRAVNRIHQEDPRCKDAIQLYSVAKADTESKAQKKPVYFVSCGHDGTIVYFDAKRADDPTPFRAPGYIDKTKAADLCEAYAKTKASHPSTVDFSRVLDLNVSEGPNGRTQVNSTFTARNSFGLELKFQIQCWFDENRFIEGRIAEAR